MAEAHTAPVSPKSDIGEAIAGLCSGLRGELLQPGDADYDGARQIWKRHVSTRRPALIARWLRGKPPTSSTQSIFARERTDC